MVYKNLKRYLLIDNSKNGNRPTRRKRKNLLPRWDSNSRLSEQITVALPNELQGQMGAGDLSVSLA